MESPAIIRDMSLTGQRSPQGLPQSIRKALTDTVRALSQPSYRSYGGRLATALSAYQAVTGDSLSRRLRDTSNSFLWHRFIGALNSARFIDIPPQTRYTYTRTAIEVAKILWPRNSTFAEIAPSSVGPTPSVERLANSFDAIELDALQVKLWRGWLVVDACGRAHWPALHSVAIRHGMEFADKLHAAIDNYWSSSKRQKIGALPLFIQALTTFTGVTPDTLLDPKFVHSFWKKFWEFYKHERSKTCKQSTVVNDWTREWKTFVTNALEGPGLLAPCLAAFPGPDTGSNTNNPRSLHDLLCALPTEHLSDEEALKFLKLKLPQSLELAKKWAQKKADDLLARRRARKRAALAGEVRTIGSSSQSLISRENPNHFANACATFEQHGFLTRKDVRSLPVLYPSSLGMVGDELGLPTTGSLLPHAVLLVAEHSELTPSMLENLNLWNQHGKLTGLSRQGNGVVYLRAPKYRGKKRTGYKSIQLNSRSLRIIREILVLTKEIRKYLEDRHIDAHRKLFITCGMAFSKPRAVKRFSTLTSAVQYTERLTNEFITSLRMESDAARDFVHRFSLRSVRLTKALCVYLETHSEAEMAKALGHAAIRNDTLERYLPPELRKFFRERAIRIFHSYQTISTMQGSKYLLCAAGFRNVAEIDSFMLKHAFPTVTTFSKTTDRPEPPSGQRGKGVVFNASPDVLRVMASLELLEKETSSKKSVLFSYWTEVSRAVLAYLRERIGLNPAIDAALRVAEQSADAKLVAHRLVPSAVTDQSATGSTVGPDISRSAGAR
ncbi:hypothetical protein [Paraburkholderia fungorum]|uniref:hypothetical protein n=1 Tax=Paraburkholderia fungorum TaxID=134537 RepID=UPI00241C4FE2|nr:hypothetical protein [Paraburkholderia fungorum]